MLIRACGKGPVSRGGRSQKEIDEEIFRKPGLPEEQRDISEWVPAERAEDQVPPQPLLLNFAQRANAVAVCACLALAFGKGTTDALETGLLPPEVAKVCVCVLSVKVDIKDTRRLDGGGGLYSMTGVSVAEVEKIQAQTAVCLLPAPTLVRTGVVFLQL